MKKLAVLFLIVILTLSCTACNSRDKSKVLDTAVESVAITLPAYGTEYSFEGDKLDEVVSLLRSQPALEKAKVDFDIMYIYNKSPVNVLKITTKKSFLQKSETYSVTVGQKTVTTRKSDNKVINNSVKADYLASSGYQGTATAELVSFLTKTLREEQNRITEMICPRFLVQL